MKTTATILNRPAFLLCALFMAAISVPSASAAVAERVTYQGNLRESGLLVTGSRSMTFRLYDAPAAGTLLWASGATAVSVSTGVFRAVLTPSGLNWESALWLEVEVAGTVLSPREELTAAPFAANALLHSGKKYTNAGAAPASPGVGDLWFDTGTSVLKFWNGSTWISTAGAGAAHAATHAGAGGDPITGLGAYTLTGNITMSPGTSLAAGVGNIGVSVSTHLVVSGSVNPASNLTVGGPGFAVAFASAVTAGWFYGNGAGLTNISAAPPANMATTDTVQTITGAKTFSAAPSVTAAGGLSVTYALSAGSAAFISGMTASSGTFTATGPGQFSLQTSSGINVLGTGGVTAAFFAGSGASLTGVAGPANMVTTDTTQTITGAKTFGGSGNYDFNGTGNVNFTNSGAGGVIVQGMKFTQSGGVTRVLDNAGTLIFSIK